MGSILQMNITYKHVIIGTVMSNDYVKTRNLLIDYLAYAIYKMWIMSENKLINLTNTCLATFIIRDLFKRTLYTKDKYFSMLCDRVIQGV